MLYIINTKYHKATHLIGVLEINTNDKLIVKQLIESFGKELKKHPFHSDIVDFRDFINSSGYECSIPYYNVVYIYNKVE